MNDVKISKLSYPPSSIVKSTEVKMSNGKSLGKSRSMNGALNGSKPVSNNNSKSLSRNAKVIGPQIHISVKYNKTTSVVSLIIHKVVNLQEVTNKTPPNPYVKTYVLENLMSSYRRDVHSKRKTKTKKVSFNPVFEDTLEYFVRPHDLQYHKIEVNIG